jgi:hypothetical protein
MISESFVRLGWEKIAPKDSWLGSGETFMNTTFPHPPDQQRRLMPHGGLEFSVWKEGSVWNEPAGTPQHG